MRSVAPITKIVPLFLWSAKMPKIYAKCQKFMQKLWNFIFCHLNIVRAVYKLSFKLLVRSVAQITKIVPPFLWFRGGLCYKHRRIRHCGGFMYSGEETELYRCISISIIMKLTFILHLKEVITFWRCCVCWEQEGLLQTEGWIDKKINIMWYQIQTAYNTAFSLLSIIV